MPLRRDWAPLRRPFVSVLACCRPRHRHSPQIEAAAQVCPWNLEGQVGDTHFPHHPDSEPCAPVAFDSLHRLARSKRGVQTEPDRSYQQIAVDGEEKERKARSTSRIFDGLTIPLA